MAKTKNKKSILINHLIEGCTLDLQPISLSTTYIFKNDCTNHPNNLTKNIIDDESYDYNYPSLSFSKILYKFCLNY
jgi:hypothetical protein